jgi:hypothetical protein
MRTLTRAEVIEDLRRVVDSWADDEKCACQAAAERGMFCKGFAQWKFGELKERYPQIMRSRRGITRPELEDLANRWQLARQWVSGKENACDVQAGETLFQQCKGWDEFDASELEGFHLELCGEEVRIVDEPERPVSDGG